MVNASTAKFAGKRANGSTPCMVESLHARRHTPLRN
jgi:hypothetical protein